MFQREANYLKHYNGNFPFFYSLREQLEKRGQLSSKQWECVTRAINREENPLVKEKVSHELCEKTIVVKRFLGYRIGESIGINRPHFAIDVNSVKAETSKAYLVECKLSAKRTSYCCVCGRTLTDDDSISRGIGPVCAEKHSVFSTEQLHQKLANENPESFELWIAKSQIKEIK